MNKAQPRAAIIIELLEIVISCLTFALSIRGMRIPMVTDYTMAMNSPTNATICKNMWFPLSVNYYQTS